LLHAFMCIHGFLSASISSVPLSSAGQPVTLLEVPVGSTLPVRASCVQILVSKEHLMGTSTSYFLYQLGNPCYHRIINHFVTDIPTNLLIYIVIFITADILIPIVITFHTVTLIVNA
jgi:hypothetical protein